MNKLTVTALAWAIFQLAGCATDEEKSRYKDNSELERPPAMTAEQEAASVVAEKDVEPVRQHHGIGLKSDVYRVENANAIKIKRPFEQGWTLVHQALLHNDFKITDDDRSSGTYYVEYDGGNLFSQATSLFGDSHKSPIYLIHVVGEGEETTATVSLAKKEEQANSAALKEIGDNSEKLVESLYDTLKDHIKEEEF